jgi:hypothetical protein
MQHVQVWTCFSNLAANACKAARNDVGVRSIDDERKILVDVAACAGRSQKSRTVIRSADVSLRVLLCSVCSCAPVLSSVLCAVLRSSSRTDVVDLGT